MFAIPLLGSVIAGPYLRYQLNEPIKASRISLILSVDVVATLLSLPFWSWGAFPRPIKSQLLDNSLYL